MIHQYDRSHYFGASEGKYIFAENQMSRSWLSWWDVKCGLKDSLFGGNEYTRAGNVWEHSILKAFNPHINFDRQIIIEDLRLRVNYDGDLQEWDGTTIVECKTHRSDRPFLISDNYWQQAQMQIYAWNNRPKIPELFIAGKDIGNPMKLKRHIIISYGLYPDEYYQEFDTKDIEEGNLPVDADRIKVHEVKVSRGMQRRIPKELRKLTRRLKKEEI